MTVCETADRVRNVLFDFDMTLVDSSEGVAAGLQGLSEVFSLRKPSKEEIRKTIGLPMPEAMKALWGDCRSEWLRHYREKLSFVERSSLKMLPGAASLLEILKEMHVSCAVVSNRGSLKELVEEFGLTSFFRTVLVLNDGLPPKPDPASLVLAMERLKAKRDDTIYIGDSTIDVEASRRAGIPCFAVTTGATPGKDLRTAGAFVVFASCLDIARLFRLRKAEGTCERDGT
jgi:HAD superfamily hydrolase (TIGR01549 family)